MCSFKFSLARKPLPQNGHKCGRPGSYSGGGPVIPAPGTVGPPPPPVVAELTNDGRLVEATAAAAAAAAAAELKSRIKL